MTEPSEKLPVRGKKSKRQLPLRKHRRLKRSASRNFKRLLPLRKLRRSLIKSGSKKPRLYARKRSWLRSSVLNTKIRRKSKNRQLKLR